MLNQGYLRNVQNVDQNIVKECTRHASDAVYKYQIISGCPEERIQ